MITNDAAVLRIRHDVLYEVAKLAWEGALDEKKEDIPYKPIPSPQVRSRCCIYRERETIHQRVRLAKGLYPADGKDTTNTVQVIGAACEGCPIARFVVTGSYQLCMGKACQNSCSFGAISMGRDRACIDPDKCKECRKCAQVYPYNAIVDLIKPCRKVRPVNTTIMDENGLVGIDESECIQCGACIHGCPFGAIGPKSLVVDVIDMIHAGKKVVAIVTPATEGQFGTDTTMTNQKTALKKIGSTDMVEVGLGDDLTAAAEATEWAEAYQDGKKMTTSYYPVFISMIKQHFPMLLENMSTTIPPICVVSRMLKEKDPEMVTILIGPCIIKKSKTLDLNIKDNADYALTYNEIRAVMKMKDMNLEPEESIYQGGSAFGERFNDGDDVTAAVLECLKGMGENTSIRATKRNGAAECKRALVLLKAGRLLEDFIEGMVCGGGCVGGPSKHKPEVEARKNRDTLTGQADDRGVHASSKNLGTTDVVMHCH